MSLGVVQDESEGLKRGVVKSLAYLQIVDHRHNPRGRTTGLGGLGDATIGAMGRKLASETCCQRNQSDSA